jgi:ankyrin repeat protein
MTFIKHGDAFMSIEYIIEWFSDEFMGVGTGALSNTASDIAKYIPGALEKMTKKDKALFIAALIDDMDIMLALIDEGANAHVCDDLILVYAATEGHNRIICALLDRGAEIRTYRNSALLGAIINDHMSTVKMLIDRGAQVTSDILYSTAKSNKVDIFRDISQRVSAAGIFDHALIIAGIKGHVEIFRMIMDRIENMIPDDILVIILFAKNRRVTAELLLRGIDLKVGFKRYDEALFLASQYDLRADDLRKQ